MTDKSTGPDLEQYVETRLNLLMKLIDKLEESIVQRIVHVETECSTMTKNVDERFAHMEQLFTLSSDHAKRSVDKAEAAQGAHNVAANEWRGTLNDFKTSLVSKAEFDRVYSEFAAFKLETARLTAAAAGEKSSTKDNKDDGRASLAIVIAAAGAIIASVISVVAIIVGLNGKPAPAPTPAPVYIQPPAK